MLKALHSECISYPDLRPVLKQENHTAVLAYRHMINERGYLDWQRTLSDADVERAIAILNRDNKAVIEEQF